jgi:hypothetical protein
MTRYAVAPPARPVSRIITPFSPESIGGSTALMQTGSTSSTWPSANLAIYVPVTIPDRASFASLRAFFVNASAVAGNVDVGIYDEAWARIASTGAVAQAGTAVVQDLAALAAVLAPGRYYLAASCSSASATNYTLTGFVAGELAALGLAQQATAHPLPATATPVAYAQTILPSFGISSVAVF